MARGKENSLKWFTNFLGSETSSLQSQTVPVRILVLLELETAHFPCPQWLPSVCEHLRHLSSIHDENHESERKKKTLRCLLMNIIRQPSTCLSVYPSVQFNTGCLTMKVINLENEKTFTVCLSICPVYCLSVCLSIYLSIKIMNLEKQENLHCLSVNPSVQFIVCLSIHLSSLLSVHPSVQFIVCLSVCPSICSVYCLFVCHLSDDENQESGKNKK